MPDISQTTPAARTSYDTVSRLNHWIIAGVLLLHIAATLKHHFINRDGTLMRMLRG